MIAYRTKICGECGLKLRVRSILSHNGKHICKNCYRKVNGMKAIRLAESNAKRTYWARRKSLLRDDDKKFLQAKYETSNLTNEEKAIRISNLQKMVEANKKRAKELEVKPSFKEEFTKLTQAKHKNSSGSG